MQQLLFDKVTKRFTANGPPAVDNVSMEVSGGDFVVLLGPSGCGKTTLLKMVNRLVEPSSGSIYLDGDDIRSLEVTALRRRIGYVIQQVGLFPHMTVAENIAVVPELVGWDRRRISDRVDELLELMHLPVDFRGRYPSQLSGGQQQRVGIARALAADPALLLMDEPFGAIDAITRTSLQDQLLELQQRLHKTILFVTHDVDEAFRLADRIVVMRLGRVVQFDDPCGLVNRPASDFVRELLDTDDRIRQLGLMRVETVMHALPDNYTAGEHPAVDAGATLRDVLSALLRPGVQAVTVMRDDCPIGQVGFDDLRAFDCEPDA